ncbi:hypothetical protein TNCT_585261, partial [Trichonephila clavata]
MIFEVEDTIAILRLDGFPAQFTGICGGVFLLLCFPKSPVSLHAKEIYKNEMIFEVEDTIAILRLDGLPAQLTGSLWWCFPPLLYQSVQFRHMKRKPVKDNSEIFLFFVTKLKWKFTKNEMIFELEDTIAILRLDGFPAQFTGICGGVFLLLCFPKSPVSLHAK